MLRRPDLESLTFEHFQDADRSGKETPKRPSYLELTARIRSAPPGEVGAVAFYDADRLHRYYGCHASRRNRSAAHPAEPSCEARLIKSEVLEEAVHYELSRCVPTDEMHAELRRRLRAATSGRPRAGGTAEAAVRRLEDQLQRARRLYEFGDYDWDTFTARRDEIQEQLRQVKATSTANEPDLEWWEAQLLDLLSAWGPRTPDSAPGWSRASLTSWRRSCCRRGLCES